MGELFYCFDENVSNNVVGVLKHLGVNCCHVTESLKAGTQDPDLIPFISSKGWVLVTGDPRMLTAHAAVLKQHSIQAVFLPKQYITNDLWYQCWWIFKHWRTVQANVEKLKTFKYVKVTDNGNVNAV